MQVTANQRTVFGHVLNPPSIAGRTATVPLVRSADRGQRTASDLVKTVATSATTAPSER